MLKKIGKYIVKKATSNVVGKTVKYVFWGLVMMFPGTMLSTVGVTGIVATGVAVHSGIVEYSTSKIIS